MDIQNYSDGVVFYTMENASGTCLTVTNAGAAAVSLIYRGTDILLGWDDASDYRINSGSLGATVGRNANRIGGARFTLNGLEICLAKNDGENNLHSGPNSWKTRLWETVETGENSVTFLMDSPDGDQGMPGHLRLSAAYTLTEDDRVELTYTASSEEDTVLNVTNHAYFNLNGHDSGDIGGHLLRVFAVSFTPSGPDLIPTGKIEAVDGTPFDFREPHPIGRDMGSSDPRIAAVGGYDHNFCLRGSGLRPAAELTGDRTGLCLTVLTDRPGMQLYTANTLRSDRGKAGAVYGSHSAVCLETQHWPDAVNRETFPSPFLRAGEPFRSQTVWALSCRA